MSFLDLKGPAGHLEALLWKVERARGAVVVCHPDPKAGGTMHNHLAYRTAAAFREAGLTSLRFNFRGVGRSTGAHDQGVGEVEDAAAALDFLAGEEPSVPLYLAGFSFGSRVALKLALRDPRVEKVLAVGMAVDLFDFAFLSELTKPKAFIHADRDEFGTVASVEALLTHVPPPKRLFVVKDCTHLAPGRLEAFSAVAREAVDWLVQL